MRDMDALRHALTQPRRQVRLSPASARVQLATLRSVLAAPRGVRVLTNEQRREISSRRALCATIDTIVASSDLTSRDSIIQKQILQSGKVSWDNALIAMHRLLVGNKVHAPLAIETYQTALLCLSQRTAASQTWQSAVQLFWHAVDRTSDNINRGHLLSQHASDRTVAVLT